MLLEKTTQPDESVVRKCLQTNVLCRFDASFFFLSFFLSFFFSLDQIAVWKEFFNFLIFFPGLSF